MNSDWPAFYAVVFALIAVALRMSLTGAMADDGVRISVPAKSGALLRAVQTAAPHTTLVLEPGRHDGPVSINKRIVLDGGGHAAIVGNGHGSVVTANADGVVIRGIEIRGSGNEQGPIDAGIKIEKNRKQVIVENNTLIANLHGINVHGARDAIVRNNKIVGRQDDRMNDRGNGVYVWNAPGTLIENNDIRFGRDGIFTNTSKKNVFRGNLFRDLRFAVHYMYTNDSEVTGNVSIGNHLGYALMFSKNITVTDNLSLRDRSHGVMLNYTNSSVVRGNLVRGRTHEKCAFIYNAHKNVITGNRFEGCKIGIHFTAGSERNRISGNAFIANRHQVKYVGMTDVEWSDKGHGNYWSDHAVYDLDGDGRADARYKPNDMMDHILWSQPAAKLLLGSPAVQLVRWSQQAFPALRAGGVIDSHPLTKPVEVAVPDSVAALERAAKPDWFKGGADADFDAVARE